MHVYNPYRAAEGRELDATIHRKFFSGGALAFCPAYSTDVAQARKLKQQLQAHYRVPIQSGRTRINGRNWFARYGSDPSTCTEVLAETLPLAICRLALVLEADHRPRRPAGQPGEAARP
jgi:hypothetical protein